ncbi:DUF4013 domain-containing protein [Methanoregula sp. UBA64]|jgi:hypothetical protein|uniref:DUF4013 domain-containing protein n=1 Tax=Methanoregula sp. UBA64 TaxID=1915554 RepID=UPI0025DAC7A0|nr:DUF4013 domain-containing protein [Methanoregula sp. UBA64]
MDYGKVLGEAFGYAKDGLVGNLIKWILLIVLEILPAIPIIAWALVFAGSLMSGATPDFMSLMGGFVVALIIAVLLGAIYEGYMLKILRGDKPLPEITELGKLFVDGIKYLVIEIVYVIPVIIVLVAVALAATLAIIKKGLLSTQNMTTVASTQNIAQNISTSIIGPVLVGVLIAVILAIILCFIATIGVIRFARTGKMGEAFNFGEIFSTIGKIGTGSYILALIIIVVIFGVIYSVLGLIPIVGPIIEIIISPFLMVFAARYICQLYDSADTA